MATAISAKPVFPRSRAHDQHSSLPKFVFRVYWLQMRNECTKAGTLDLACRQSGAAVIGRGKEFSCLIGKKRRTGRATRWYEACERPLQSCWAAGQRLIPSVSAAASTSVPSTLVFEHHHYRSTHLKNPEASTLFVRFSLDPDDVWADSFRTSSWVFSQPVPLAATQWTSSCLAFQIL